MRRFPAVPPPPLRLRCGRDKMQPKLCDKCVMYMSDSKQLLSLVERLERLDEENRDLNEGRKEILVEAKSNGWDPKMVKAVVAYRRDPEASEARSARLDEYLTLLGSSGSPKNNAPAATVARLRAVPVESSRAGAGATQLAAATSPPPRGDEAAPGTSGAASPISEAAPALGVVGGDRTDAASSHSAAVRSAGGGNLAGTEMSGHSLSDDTDPSLDIRNQPFNRGGETWPR